MAVLKKAGGFGMMTWLLETEGILGAFEEKIRNGLTEDKTPLTFFAQTDEYRAKVRQQSAEVVKDITDFIVLPYGTESILKASTLKKFAKAGERQKIGTTARKPSGSSVFLELVAGKKGPPFKITIGNWPPFILDKDDLDLGKGKLKNTTVHRVRLIPSEKVGDLLEDKSFLDRIDEEEEEKEEEERDYLFGNNNGEETDDYNGCDKSIPTLYSSVYKANNNGKSNQKLSVEEKAIAVHTTHRLLHYISDSSTFTGKSLADDEKREEILSQLNQIVKQFGSQSDKIKKMDASQLNINQFSHDLLNEDRIRSMDSSDSIRFIIAVKNLSDYCQDFNDEKRINLGTAADDAQQQFIEAIFGFFEKLEGVVKSYVKGFAKETTTFERVREHVKQDASGAIMVPLLRKAKGDTLKIYKDKKERKAKKDQKGFERLGIIMVLASTYIHQIRQVFPAKVPEGIRPFKNEIEGIIFRVQQALNIPIALTTMLPPSVESTESEYIDALFDKKTAGKDVKKALLSTAKSLAGKIRSMDDFNEAIIEAHSKGGAQARSILKDLDLTQKKMEKDIETQTKITKKKTPESLYSEKKKNARAVVAFAQMSSTIVIRIHEALPVLYKNLAVITVVDEAFG